MKILLAIPSHNRPYDIVKKIGYWIKDIEIDYKVFCERHQMIYYTQTIGQNNLVATPDGSGLMGQIVEIGKYADKNGYDIVLKMDDDMRFTKDGNKKPSTGELINEIIIQCMLEFEKPEVSLISVCKPMEYRYGAKEGFVNRKKPVYGNYFVRTEYLLKLSKDLLMFDDLWISLEVKLDGKKALTYLGAYEDAITHKNEGGLQTFDRDAMGRDSYEVAKVRYPAIKVLENSKHGTFDIDVKDYFKNGVLTNLTL